MTPSTPRMHAAALAAASACAPHPRRRRARRRRCCGSWRTGSGTSRARPARSTALPPSWPHGVRAHTHTHTCEHIRLLCVKRCLVASMQRQQPQPQPQPQPARAHTHTHTHGTQCPLPPPAPHLLIAVSVSRAPAARRGELSLGALLLLSWQRVAAGAPHARGHGLQDAVHTQCSLRTQCARCGHAGWIGALRTRQCVARRATRERVRVQHITLCAHLIVLPLRNGAAAAAAADARGRHPHRRLSVSLLLEIVCNGAGAVRAVRPGGAGARPRLRVARHRVRRMQHERGVSGCGSAQHALAVQGALRAATSQPAHQRSTAPTSGA
jgi:hypothetical protein